MAIEQGKLILASDFFEPHLLVNKTATQTWQSVEHNGDEKTFFSFTIPENPYSYFSARLTITGQGTLANSTEIWRSFKFSDGINHYTSKVGWQLDENRTSFNVTLYSLPPIAQVNFSNYVYLNPSYDPPKKQFSLEFGPTLSSFGANDATCSIGGIFPLTRTVKMECTGTNSTSNSIVSNITVSLKIYGCM